MVSGTGTSEVPQDEFLTAPGAHYPNLEDPAAFTTTVRDFLERLAADDRRASW